MTKNPFELRADVLALAKSYLDDQYKINTGVAQQLNEIGEKSAAELQVAMKPYSIETLTETAEDMYKFVRTKTRDG